MNNICERLVGKKVVAVRMDETYLGFAFDDGTNTGFTVEGDCCSYSYFHDFYGIDKLLANGPITEVSEVYLGPGDPGYIVVDNDSYNCIRVYGYRIVTVSPQWGEQTSVFVFRNSSNGYYGGWMNDDAWPEDLPDILTADVILD